MSDYLATVEQYLIDALSAKSITRTRFNYVRRCGVLLDESQAEMWNALNDGIWRKAISIVEDGDTVFEVALSFDDVGRVNRVMSL